VKIAHQSDARLEVLIRQIQFFRLAIALPLGGILMAGAGFLNGDVPAAVNLAIVTAGLALGALFAGYEKHDVFVFDAPNDRVSVTTRQFWRYTEFTAPLRDVATIDLRHSDHQEVQFFAIEFHDIDGHPLGFHRHIEPGRRANDGLRIMRAWLEAHRKRHGLRLAAT
jgi:hypothetical protein